MITQRPDRAAIRQQLGLEGNLDEIRRRRYLLLHGTCAAVTAAAALISIII
jgi:hypothetical protein